MQIKDVMTKRVASCNRDTSSATAAAIMWNEDCGTLPVVEDGRAVGIVTDRDLLIALGTRNQRPEELPVGQVMQTGLAVCAPEDDLRTALKTMAQRKLRRLPVVDRSGALAGIVSLNDIAAQARQGKDGLSDSEIAQAMQSICEPLVRREAGRERKRAAQAVA